MVYTVNHRTNALRIYFSGHSFRYTSRTAHIPKSTIHDWVKKIGDMRYKYNGRKRQNSPKIREENLRVELMIVKLLNKNPFHTLFSIKHTLMKTKQKMLSLSKIYRIIRSSGHSYKKVSWRTPTRDVSGDKQVFNSNYTEFYKKGFNMVSIDETGFVSNDLPLRGYGKRGETLHIEKRHPKRFKVSSVCGMSQDGTFHQKTVHGNINGVIFRDFLKDLFAKLPPASVAILDNIAFHKSKKVLEIADRFGVRLMYTPPSSPECNPIENIFSVFKQNARKRFVMSDFEDGSYFRNVVLSAIRKSCRNQSFANYFKIPDAKCDAGDDEKCT